MDARQIRIRTKLLRAGVSAVAIAVAALTIGPGAASAQPSLFAAGSQGQCVANRSVNAFLRANHASVLRLILSPQRASVGAGIGCVQAAHAAGFKVYISFQFNNGWTPNQAAAYFRRVLPSYAPFVWAVGVGNEQDLTSASAYGQGPRPLGGHGRSAGQNYRAVWDAVERVLVQLAPHAIRVYGEFSPWSFSATEQGFASGRPPGVQAIAAHCYHTKVGGLTQVPQDGAWAASERLPLWCSEMGPAFRTTTTPRWAVPDTWKSWNALVADIEAKTPDLAMTGYYYDPSF